MRTMRVNVEMGMLTPPNSSMRSTHFISARGMIFKGLKWEAKVITRLATFLLCIDLIESRQVILKPAVHALLAGAIDRCF